jgi:exosortase A-associated hydrolase 1
MEFPVRFRCEADWLNAIVHRPAQPLARGVLVIVGGPQHRVGSHRQFVLLARALAEQGIATMRFDYRGMGDSGGMPHTFEQIDADIDAAIKAFVAHVPQLKEVVLWGLCDAASAALFYASRSGRGEDPMVVGLVLLNPWVRTEAGIAGAYLRHYYLARVVDADFWRKVFRGEVKVASVVKSIVSMVITRLGWSGVGEAEQPRDKSAPLPDRMLSALRGFSGRVLLILSGDDLTAEEFRHAAKSSREWRNALGATRVTRQELAAANHTFARKEWRDQVIAWTDQWLRSW